jgi:hypothetical protein
LAPFFRPPPLLLLLLLPPLCLLLLLLLAFLDATIPLLLLHTLLAAGWG